MKQYIEIKENPAKITHIKVELRYSLGGLNYFTGTTERRGYYLSVTPVEVCEREDGYTTERFTAFVGMKKLIKEVGRKSAKAEAEAEKLAEDIVENLIDYVCETNHLAVKSEDDETIPLF